MPKNDWSYVSTVIAFQNIFFWQEMMAGKTQPVKYAEVVIARLTGIGGILAHLSDFSRFLADKNCSVYLSPGCTRYPDDVLTRYFRIQAKPADATPENTVMIDNYGFYSITCCNITCRTKEAENYVDRRKNRRSRSSPALLL